MYMQEFKFKGRLVQKIEREQTDVDNTDCSTLPANAGRQTTGTMSWTDE